MGMTLSNIKHSDFATTFPYSTSDTDVTQTIEHKDHIKISECVKMLCNVHIYNRMVDVS